MIRQAYISCPLTVPSGDLEAVIMKAKSFNLNKVHYYGRGTAYDTAVYDKVIRESDAFILILPNMAWSIEYSKLTSGCRREFDVAMQNPNMQLFIAYKTSSGSIYIYIYSGQINYNKTVTHSISGLSCTAGNFAQEVAKGNTYTKQSEELKEIAKKQMAAPAKAPDKKSSLKDYFGVGYDWDDMPQEAVPNKPRVNHSDLVRYSGLELSLWEYANNLYNSNRSLPAEDFHAHMEEHIRKVRQVQKVEKLRQAYHPTDHISKLNSQLSKRGIDYHELLKKHLEHRTPVQEQPLAMIMPKEALEERGYLKDGPTNVGMVYTTSDGKTHWEWAIPNPYYIDERLVMFF